MNTSIPHYTVFGNPIAHSKSPHIHQLFAQQEGVALHYSKTLVNNQLSAFQAATHCFFQEGGLGANITLPFKEFAYQIAHQHTERAKAAGAVNTFILQDKHTLLGDNTDGAGLVQDLCQNLNISLRNKHILILGAGGAARGVISPLLEQQPAQLTIANRTQEKAQLLAQHFAIQSCVFEKLSGHYDIIINATSSSLNHEIPSIPLHLFSGCLLAYDMFYSKQATHFMNIAQQYGAKHTADGLGMLVGQAAESYYQWRGFRPDIHSVITILRAELSI